MFRTTDSLCELKIDTDLRYRRRRHDAGRQCPLVTFLPSPLQVALARSFLIGSVAFVGTRILPEWRAEHHTFNFCVAFLVTVGRNRVGYVLTTPYDIP
ncbi:MAG: hypothetical protein ACYDDO_03275 [Acidiferrobacterales bacterium]